MFLVLGIHAVLQRNISAFTFNGTIAYIVMFTDPYVLIH